MTDTSGRSQEPQHANPRRRSVRYEDFAAPRRGGRRWWIAAIVSVLAIAGGLAAFLLLPQREAAAGDRPPPALSTAGRPIVGEAYQWRHVAFGGGGMISGLSFDASGKTFVVRTDVYGAYRWNERAGRWDQVVTTASMPGLTHVQNGIGEGVYEIAVAPSRASRLYMAVKGRVYRSDDGGANWTLPTAGNPFPLVWNPNSEDRLHGPFMAVDPANPDLVLLGTPAAGLWRSADAGASWSRVASVPASRDRDPAGEGVQAPGTMLWFEQPLGGRPTGRLFAMAPGSGMFVSADKGASFRPLEAAGDQPLTLQRGTFDRHGTFFAVDDINKSVWSYRDRRWRNLTTEKGLRASDYAAVAANPRADQIVVLDRGGRGYASADGGETWSNVTKTGVAEEGDPPWLKSSADQFFTTADLRFDPVVPNRLWLASGTGVFRADLPPGSTSLEWVSQTRGIEEMVANDAVQPPGRAPVFAFWDFGFHVKDDLTAFSTTFAPNERFIAAQQVDWTPARAGFLVTNASDTRTTCCWEDGNSVMAGTSRNGGRDWTKFATLPHPPGTKADDPWRMAFGTIAVSSSDPDNIVWEPYQNRQPFYTADGGRSWKPVTLPGATGPNPGSFQHHWLQRKTLTADKSQAATFYLVHSGEAPNQGLQGLWRSVDGGASWERRYPGEIAPASNMAAKLRSVPGRAGHLFFTSGFEHTTDTDLRRSRDGGLTWQRVDGVNHVDDVAFGKAAPGASYPTLFLSGRVSGEYGIWRSTDDARSWQRLVDFPVGTLDQVTVVAADPDVFGRVYVGYLGSSFIWGEPAACTPAPIRPLQPVQCSAVR